MNIFAIETQRRLFGVVFLLLFLLGGVGTVAQQSRKGESGVSIISDPKTGTILINAKLNGDPIVMILRYRSESLHLRRPLLWHVRSAVAGRTDERKGPRSQHGCRVADR